ncbi:hypothetical protein [Paenibacillus illinoisensis]|uniref:hypothetical protein n=1 Tax=Paenibacillus illinoisensis TaxID=59845 RepID=UPI00301E3FA9
MREQKRALIGGVIGIVIAVAAFAIYYFVNLNTTFQKAVLDEVNNVDNAYLQIVRIPKSTDTNEDVLTHTMDMNGFQDVSNQLSGLDLKKVDKPINDSNAAYTYTIYIRNKSDNSEVASFSVDNSKQISIGNSNGYQRYEITNSFDYEAFCASVDKLLTEN